MPRLLNLGSRSSDGRNAIAEFRHCESMVVPDRTAIAGFGLAPAGGGEGAANVLRVTTMPSAQATLRWVPLLDARRLFRMVRSG
jgi:hypothetical protein